MEQTRIDFRKARDFGALLNATFDYLKLNFKIIIKSNLFIAGPTILLTGVFLGIYQSSLFSFDPNSTIPQIGIPFLLAIIFSLISYFIIMVVTYSHLMVYKKTENSAIEIEDVWQAAKKNFMMLMSTAIGYVFILGLIGAILVGVGFYLTFEGYYFFVLVGLFGIGLLIYLSINYSLIFIIRLEEGLGFSDALKRSKSLITNNWWFTFGLIFVIGIIQSFIMYAFYIPSYIIMFFSAFAAANGESNGFTKSLSIFSSILTSFGVMVYTISTIATAFQYFNLVERKEAPGLLEQIESIK